MSTASVQIVRLVAVMVLIIAAAALATPKGRLPLALRGVLRILHRDCGLPAATGVAAVPVWKRLAAFVLVLVAFGVTVIPIG